MNVKFCLVFPREALSVPVMRHVLGDTLRDLGADDDGVADLLLAVTEACSNVVKHGGPGQRYEVLASVGQGGCEVQVVNSGRGTDAGRWPGLRQRRGVPAAGPIMREGLAALLEGSSDFELLAAHMIREVGPRGVDKGAPTGAPTLRTSSSGPGTRPGDGLGRGDRGAAGVRARLGDHEGVRG